MGAVSSTESTAYVEGGRVLRGTLRVPGDKSVSHRALILAALARRHQHVSRDSAPASTSGTPAPIVEALGARITGSDGRHRVAP